MAKLGALAAGALALTVAAGAAEQADAQATELIFPHPDGELVIDVTQVALDTQMQIIEQLQVCLEEGRALADFDANGLIEGDEDWDWLDAQAFCAETAQNNVAIASEQTQQAALQGQIDLANAEQAALQARRDAANEEIRAITEGLISGAQEEQGS